MRPAEYTKIDTLIEVSESYFEIQFGLTRDYLMKNRCRTPWWFLIESRARYSFPTGNNPDILGWFQNKYWYYRGRFLKHVLKQDVDLELYDLLISRF